MSYASHKAKALHKSALCWIKIAYVYVGSTPYIGGIFFGGGGLVISQIGGPQWVLFRNSCLCS